MSYSIGEAADLTGVKAVTLRAWESRYGIVRPVRTGSSYRRYSERDLDLVRRMRLLVESGVPARRAAALTADQSAAGAEAASPRPAGLRDTSAIARAGADFDAPALRRVLDEAFATADAATVIDRWLMPSLREVGRAWQTGRLDIVSEHVISSAIMRKLSALFEATPARGPRVVVGLPARCRHELPALACALLLQRAGAQVLYLGADVPPAGWERVATAWHPRGAVTAATTSHDVAAASAVVETLAACRVRHVYVGGSAATQVRGAVPVPRSLAAAAQAVATAVSDHRAAR